MNRCLFLDFFRGGLILEFIRRETTLHRNTELCRGKFEGTIGIDEVVSDILLTPFVIKKKMSWPSRLIFPLKK